MFKGTPKSIVDHAKKGRKKVKSAIVNDNELQEQQAGINDSEVGPGEPAPKKKK